MTIVNLFGTVLAEVKTSLDYLILRETTDDDGEIRYTVEHKKKKYKDDEHYVIADLTVHERLESALSNLGEWSKKVKTGEFR